MIVMLKESYCSRFFSIPYKIIIILSFRVKAVCGKWGHIVHFVFHQVLRPFFCCVMYFFVDPSKTLFAASPGSTLRGVW